MTENASKAMLSIRDLHKTFDSDLLKKKQEVLKGVNLTVNSGEIYGFLGPNGAGKTTTIKIITSLIFADKGIISIGGTPHTTGDARKKIGFMPETPGFYRHLNGRELLVFFANLLDLPRGEIDGRVDELLKLVGLWEKRDTLVGAYSKGMTQRIALAQALLHKPPLLILDEPLSGLDPIGRADFRDILLNLRENGVTIFFSSHIIPDVESICDRVGILLNGRIQAEGDIDEIVDMEINHYDITFTGEPEQKFSFDVESSNSGGDSTFIRIAAADKAKAIEEIQKLGGDIIRVSPVRASLEEVLIGKIREEGQ